VFDALPILQTARIVRVIAVNQQGDWEEDQDICRSLEWHGIDCEPVEAVDAYHGVGQTILGFAKDNACDLLIMGCYGHSRLREFIMGGATRHVLDQMTIPVLMSH
jgi:nucleotide-binding universal stress UspA family protein